MNVDTVKDDASKPVVTTCFKITVNPKFHIFAIYSKIFILMFLLNNIYLTFTPRLRAWHD